MFYFKSETISTHINPSSWYFSSYLFSLFLKELFKDLTNHNDLLQYLFEINLLLKVLSWGKCQIRFQVHSLFCHLHHLQPQNILFQIFQKSVILLVHIKVTTCIMKKSQFLKSVF